MTSPSPALSRGRAAYGFAVAAAILAALTAVRLIGLKLSTVDLFFDEAQYWAWSRELAFGYFSKPPLLAWIIAATDPLCGSGEACVRSASPVLYLGTGLLAYATARELYDAQTAFWTALTLALATGVIFSTRIISTDVPLLFCWALALLAYVKLLRGPDWRWALTLGIALGLGLLAKYAMAYFLLGVAVAAAFDRSARVLLRNPQVWVALAVAVLMLAPNVVWNISNGFITLKHTGDNISGGGLDFRPLKALEFVLSQFAVFGPLLFAGFLAILVRAGRAQFGRKDRLMLAFAIPPLAIVTALAFFRGANANWAAPAFISAVILVTAVWVRQHRWRWIQATLAIGAAVQVTLLIGDAMAYRITLPVLGPKADLYQRTLGWRGLGEAVRSRAREAGAPTIAAEGRAELASLTYYLRDEPRRVVSWPAGAQAHSQFDITQGLDAKAADPVRFVSQCPFTARLLRYYRNVTPLGQFKASSGPSSGRSYDVFKLAGRSGPLGPLGPCVAAPPG